jgi:hypothetical protein
MTIDDQTVDVVSWIEFDGEIENIAESMHQLAGARVLVGSVRTVGASVQRWDAGGKRWTEVGRAGELDRLGVVYWENVFRDGVHVGHVAVDHVVDRDRVRCRLIYLARCLWASS